VFDRSGEPSFNAAMHGFDHHASTPSWSSRLARDRKCQEITVHERREEGLREPLPLGRAAVGLSRACRRGDDLADRAAAVDESRKR
jgi:hypothetical protein